MKLNAYIEQRVSFSPINSRVLRCGLCNLDDMSFTEPTERSKMVLVNMKWRNKEEVVQVLICTYCIISLSETLEMVCTV